MKHLIFVAALRGATPILATPYLEARNTALEAREAYIDALHNLHALEARTNVGRSIFSDVQ